MKKALAIVALALGLVGCCEHERVVAEKDREQYKAFLMALIVATEANDHQELKDCKRLALDVYGTPREHGFAKVDAITEILDSGTENYIDILEAKIRERESAMLESTDLRTVEAVFSDAEALARSSAEEQLSGGQPLEATSTR